MLSDWKTAIEWYINEKSGQGILVEKVINVKTVKNILIIIYSALHFIIRDVLILD